MSSARNMSNNFSSMTHLFDGKQKGDIECHLSKPNLMNVSPCWSSNERQISNTERILENSKNLFGQRGQQVLKHVRADMSQTEKFSLNKVLNEQMVGDNTKSSLAKRPNDESAAAPGIPQTPPRVHYDVIPFTSRYDSQSLTEKIATNSAPDFVGDSMSCRNPRNQSTTDRDSVWKESNNVVYDLSDSANSSFSGNVSGLSNCDRIIGSFSKAASSEVKSSLPLATKSQSTASSDISREQYPDSFTDVNVAALTENAPFAIAHQSVGGNKSGATTGFSYSSVADGANFAAGVEVAEAQLVEYRGHKMASFEVDGRVMVCLPQAYDLFLKYLVGGLHTVYTKLKRLDIVPFVCNVEQVRALRSIGAIQPGVNRCKLISCEDFDTLYEDCASSSSKPGRPPKRFSIFGDRPFGCEKFDVESNLKKAKLGNASPATALLPKPAAAPIFPFYNINPQHLLMASQFPGLFMVKQWADYGKAIRNCIDSNSGSMQQNEFGTVFANSCSSTKPDATTSENESKEHSFGDTKNLMAFDKKSLGDSDTAVNLTFSHQNSSTAGSNITNRSSNAFDKDTLARESDDNSSTVESTEKNYSDVQTHQSHMLDEENTAYHKSRLRSLIEEETQKTISKGWTNLKNQCCNFDSATDMLSKRNCSYGSPSTAGSYHRDEDKIDNYNDNDRRNNVGNKLHSCAEEDGIQNQHFTWNEEERRQTVQNLLLSIMRLLEITAATSKQRDEQLLKEKADLYVLYEEEKRERIRIEKMLCEEKRRKIIYLKRWRQAVRKLATQNKRDLAKAKYRPSRSKDNYIIRHDEVARDRKNLHVTYENASKIEPKTTNHFLQDGFSISPSPTPSSSSTVSPLDKTAESRHCEVDLVTSAPKTPFSPFKPNDQSNIPLHVNLCMRKAFYRDQSSGQNSCDRELTTTFNSTNIAKTI